MFDFDTDVDKKLNAPSKRKIYNMLAERAGECLETAKSVCLLGLSNWRYGEWILAEHKNVERVTIIESSQLKFIYIDLESLVKYNIIYVNDDKYIDALESLEMKFDCIIMNPPYSRNLHLKILAEAIKHLSDDGICVCLHPSKWIHRFDYWRTKAIIPIRDAKFLSDAETSTLFDAAIGSQLMITVAAKNGNLDYKKYSRFLPWVKEKIIDKAQWLFNNPKCPGRTTNPNAKFILNLPIVHGHIGCADMTELTSKNYNIALKSAFGKRPQDINSFVFDSEEERKNFYNSLFTRFYKFLIVICRDGQTAGSCYYAIPWLGDATNPRTGLKGYKGEWTDADLYQFFNITPEEQKVIEETMEKYR